MPFDFSSDLSSGRRPTSKSEEKSKGIPIVLEIVWCEQLFTAEKVLFTLHLIGASLRDSDIHVYVHNSSTNSICANEDTAERPVLVGFATPACALFVRRR